MISLSLPMCMSILIIIIDHHSLFQTMINRYSILTNFVTTDLSATYFDTVKDRLYTDLPSSPRRRATQTVLYTVLQTLPRLVGPILPFLAEEVYSHMQSDPTKSVFEDGYYYQLNEQWASPCIEETWSRNRMIVNNE